MPAARSSSGHIFIEGSSFAGYAFCVPPQLRVRHSDLQHGKSSRHENSWPISIQQLPTSSRALRYFHHSDRPTTTTPPRGYAKFHETGLSVENWTSVLTLKDMADFEFQIICPSCWLMRESPADDLPHHSHRSRKQYQPRKNLSIPLPTMLYRITTETPLSS